MRIVIGVAALLLLGTFYAAAQDPEVQPDIPGLYGMRKCTTADFPVELPSLDSVLNSAKLTLALRDVGADKRIIFALRLGGLQSTPRVRVLEKEVSDAVVELAAQSVEGALHEIPSDRPWAFRLIVDDRAQTLTLTKSQVCGGSPAPSSRNVGPGALRAAPASEVRAMQREAEENRRRRREMRHRVLVDARGRVLDVELLATSGDGQMDVSEANALRNASFVPTKLDGVAVTAWVELRGDWLTRP